MSPEEGIERIVFHAQPVSGSFLDMLRPYRGIRDEVLEDLVAALRASASELSAERPRRVLVSAIWAISYFGRLWGLDPNGMLRRNSRINDVDLQRLSSFLSRFDHVVAMLLEGVAQEQAFADFSSAR